MWFHVVDGAGILHDAAWCYPKPLAGRENIKSCLTFSIGKGVTVCCDPVTC